jgi:FkbM family methyltransferase
MYALIRSKLYRAWSQVRSDGFSSVARRLIRDWSLGRQIECNGNRVNCAGLTISVNNPHIATRPKSMFATGDYERPELNVIERLLPRDYPVIELGGSIGVVACFTNRRLEHPEQHIVVEAHPELIPTLLENANINNCKYQVVSAALAYDTELVTFYSGSTFLAGSIYPTGRRSYSVPATSLSMLLNQFGTKQVCLISDIEGSEIQLVEKELEVLQTRVRWAFFETHPEIVGIDAVSRMLARLGGAGFIERHRENDVIALENRQLPKEGFEKDLPMNMN